MNRKTFKILCDFIDQDDVDSFIRYLHTDDEYISMLPKMCQVSCIKGAIRISQYLIEQQNVFPQHIYVGINRKKSVILNLKEKIYSNPDAQKNMNYFTILQSLYKSKNKQLLGDEENLVLDESLKDHDLYLAMKKKYVILEKL